MQCLRNRCNRRVSEAAAVGQSLEKQVEAWQRRALFWTLVAVVVIYFAAKAIGLGLHMKAAYKSEFDKVVKEREQEEPLRIFCDKMPAGYKTDTVNCDEHRQRLTKDPHACATEVAFHEFTDHLSILNWILNCHRGVCDGWIWRFVELVLSHFGQLVLLTILALVLAILVVAGPVRSIWKWRRTLNKHVQIQEHLRKENNPGQKLLDTVNDSAWLNRQMSATQVHQKLTATLQQYSDMHQQQRVENQGHVIYCPLEPGGDEMIPPTADQQIEGRHRKYKTDPVTPLRRRLYLHDINPSNV